MRLSYSKLDTFQSCPLRYRLAYIDRLPRKPKPHFKLGRTIHVALHAFHLYKKGKGSLEELLGHYRDAWGVMRNPKLAESPHYRKGVEILTKYFEATRDQDAATIACEEKFEIPVGIHTLVGSFDCINVLDGDRKYEVLDYKLDKHLPSQEEVDRDLQLSIYHLAFTERWGEPPDILSLYFLRHGVKLTTVRTSKQANETFELVKGLAENIERETEFLPQEGTWCSYCDYPEYCPKKSPWPKSVPGRRHEQLALGT